MKRLVLLTCLLVVGFVLIGCNELLESEEIATETFEVLVIEVDGQNIIAIGMGAEYERFELLNTENLLEIGIFIGAHLMITVYSPWLESFPAPVHVLEWWHFHHETDIVLIAFITELTDDYVFATGYGYPFDYQVFEFNRSEFPFTEWDLHGDLHVGARLRISINQHDWPTPPRIFPGSILSWEFWHSQEWINALEFADKDALRELWYYLENYSDVAQVRNYVTDYWRMSGYTSQSFTYDSWTEFAWSVMVASDTLNAPVLFTQEEVDSAYSKLRIAYENLDQVN